MAFTYQQFLDTAKNAGLLGQFSSYDLSLAKTYPEFGMNMVKLKQQWNSAGSDAARTAVNNAANALRLSYGNYTGGTDGLDYISGGIHPGSMPQNPDLDRVKEELLSFGDFSFDTPAPTYTSRYDGLMKDLTEKLTAYPEFSYDPQKDTAYSQYKKQYLREGDRAASDALGKMAAQNGGQVSTTAAAAASQAGDYYASQLNDKIPELRQNALGEYQAGYENLLSQIGTVGNLQKMEYQQYLDQYDQWQQERSNAYAAYLDRFGMLEDRYDLLTQENDRLYDRLLDQIAFDQDRREGLYEAEQEALKTGTQSTEDARDQVDAILKTGTMPPESLIAASGYPREYIEALFRYYRNK